MPRLAHPGVVVLSRQRGQRVGNAEQVLAPSVEAFGVGVRGVATFEDRTRFATVDGEGNAGVEDGFGIVRQCATARCREQGSALETVERVEAMPGWAAAVVA